MTHISQASRPQRARGLRAVRGSAAALMAAAILTGVPASASTGHTAGPGPLTFEGLAPGIGATRTLTVAAPKNQQSRMWLGVADLRSDDRGCLLQERRAGDVTCGVGQGELLRWLRVRVERVLGGVPVPVYDGRLADLRWGTLLGGPLRAGSSTTLRVTVTPDVAMGNDTMTDAVSFDVWWASTPNLLWWLGGYARSDHAMRGTGSATSAGVADETAATAGGAVWRSVQLPRQVAEANDRESTKGTGVEVEPLAGETRPGLHVEQGVVSMPELVLISALWILIAALARRTIADLIRRK